MKNKTSNKSFKRERDMRLGLLFSILERRICIGLSHRVGSHERSMAEPTTAEDVERRTFKGIIEFIKK